MKSTEPQNGIWNQWLADTYHQSSPKLAKFLSKILPKDKPVIDLGCGAGFYIAKLAGEGFKCIGVEGFALSNFLHNDILIHDLTKPVDLGWKGSVISLEVIEHIDKQYEDIVLDTITNHCNGILVFSWALTGQAGIGHVNLVDQDYAIKKVEERGFKLNQFLTEVGRSSVDANCNWFERTLLIFERV